MPSGKTPASVRSIPASPNSLTPRVSFAGATVSLAVVTVLTFASAMPAAVRSWAGPQHGAVSFAISQAPDAIQRESRIVGLSVWPPSKSYRTRTSPPFVVERLTRPSDVDAQPPALPWLNSNAMCADGDVVF